jgi:hypothetical protein
MSTTYHARDWYQLSQGTYYVRFLNGASATPTILRYVLGECEGYVDEIPAGLREYTPAEKHGVRGAHGCDPER